MHNVTVIRRSCITGKALWIYQGPSKNAAKVAYHRAVKKEIERVKNYKKELEARKAAVLRILNNCMAALPIGTELTPRQKAAAKTLLAISNEKVPCYMEFYDHIMESRRRREEDRRIRQQMREREKKQESRL
jgi:hypothetical protein